MFAIGSLEFSFESSELLYRFGLNFYQSPASPVASEVSVIDTSESRTSSAFDTRSGADTIAGEPEVISESGNIDYIPNIEVAGSAVQIQSRSRVSVARQGSRAAG